MSDYFDQRAWAEININNLVYNHKQVKALAGDAKIMAIIKADAYGHGSVEVAKALVLNDIAYLAVAAPIEAFRLREGGITAPILILGAVPFEIVPQLAKQNITLSVPSVEHAKMYSEALGCDKIKVHIKLDTGMCRYGFIVRNDISEAITQIEQVYSFTNLIVEGIFTHFASADAPDGKHITQLQCQRFNTVIEKLKTDGFNPKYIHCCNSAGIMTLPSMHFNMVREGILLYGYPPSEYLSKLVTLKPVMSLKTTVAQVKYHDAGESIGYNEAYKTTRKTKIATVPIGYADGLFRHFGKNLTMLIHGKQAALLGRICMDICMLDVTDIDDVIIGDEVTVFGQSSEGVKAPLETIAKNADTITYEVLCGINGRVPRKYIY